MRFANVSIPPNATITRAYVQFTVKEAVGSTGLSLTIKGFAQDNTATFTTATSNISSRPVTTATVTGWAPPLWPTIGAAGVDQRTPELKTIVQEIVNRPGWASGNALGIVITGPGGVRNAGSFDNGTGSQPVLHVEFTTTTIIDRAVAAGTDDAEENTASGWMNLTSSDLELVTDGTIDQRVGMRFANLSIPPNATITRAYVQFTVKEAVGSTGLSLTIKGFAHDNTATFTTATSNISLRPVTTATVTGWAPPLWSTIGAAGVDQRTPELKTIVQEIVNRPGWASGNALGIVVTGPGGVRNAGAFDNGTGTQPVLHVEYTVP
jgi:hypothetical protein